LHPTGIAQVLFAEGKNEGRQEGQQEGLHKGPVIALQSSVVEALEAKFDVVPEGLHEVIEAISEETTLSATCTKLLSNRPRSKISQPSCCNKHQFIPSAHTLRRAPVLCSIFSITHAIA